jgi:hexulose-6-phosphate isomerase
VRRAVTIRWDRRELCAAAGAAAAAAMVGAAAPRPPKIRKAMMYGALGHQGTVLEQFQALKNAGFEGVEPMSHMDVKAVAAALEKTGLKAPSVCCATHWDKPLSDPDPKVREAGAAGLTRALEDAKAYGAATVLLVPGVVNDKVTYDECFKRSVEEVRKILPTAEKLGVKIAVENVWNDFITKVEQAVAFLDAVGSPRVGWYFDTGNVIRYAAPETWIPALGRRILMLHIKEYGKAKGFGVKYLEGDNNWPAIMKALRDVGYEGWGIAEQPGDQSGDAAGLKDLAARMDKIFAS